MKILSLLICISLSACIQTKDKTKLSTANRQDGNIVEAKKELQDSLAIFKTQYVRIYEDKLANASEGAVKEQMATFNTLLLNTTGFMDSLWAYVDTMDFELDSNVLLIRHRFVNEGLGDTLYRRLNIVFDQAKNIAPKSAHSSIDAQRKAVFSHQDVDSWKKQYFWLVNPLGVNILLYGFQSSVLKMAYETMLPPKQF